MSSNVIYKQLVLEGAFLVSTVELTDSHQPSEASQFETMVSFNDGTWINQDVTHYSAREHAKNGHQKVVSRWEAAELLTCLECLIEGQESVAVRLPQSASFPEPFCTDSLAHRLFCSACSYEERCAQHVPEDAPEC